MASILIAGCGDVGTRLGLRLAGAGYGVWGLRRDVSGLPSAIVRIRADLSDPDSLKLGRRFDYVFYMPSPGVRDAVAYRAVYVDGVRNLNAALEAAGDPPVRLYYVSSTGVYGHTGGEWVDEASPAQPASFSGQLVLQGERAARSAGLACTVMRFAGIYGPGRTWLVDRVRSGAPCIADPPLYTNRMHSDDCAAALHHLLELPQPDDIYIGADDEPAPQCEVMRWLAARLGVAPPRSVSAAQVHPPPGNKRCSNALLRKSGFVPCYRSYREGYAALLASTSSGVAGSGGAA